MLSIDVCINNLKSKRFIRLVVVKIFLFVKLSIFVIVTDQFRDSKPTNATKNVRHVLINFQRETLLQTHQANLIYEYSYIFSVSSYSLNKVTDGRVWLDWELHNCVSKTTYVTWPFIRWQFCLCYYTYSSTG